MKKTRMVILCLLSLLLAACGSAAEAPQTTAAPPVETTRLPQLHTPVLCPWEYDVCAGAVSDGRLHYYFLSAEGQKTDENGNILPDGGEIAKWGDCCLIVFPDGQTMLIDCGLATVGPILTENLRRMQITRLDHIVITHPHSDHQGGIFHPKNLTGEGVLDQFDIGTVYHRGGSDPSREDAFYVENACKERDLPLQVLEMGDALQIGAVTARVLWPKEGTWEKEITGTANVNNSSIVIRFDYAEHSSLFTGDLYDDGEFALMSAHSMDMMDVDLLKAPHHAQYTSGSEVFLSLVSPEITVATGFEPITDETRIRYEKSGTLLLSDIDRGFIHVSTDGKDMTWEASRP